MKKIMIISYFAVSILFLLSASACHAGWFSKEKEVKDEYLEKLFAPDFPYESVKVVEDSKGRRFIVVKAKEKVDKLLGKYDDLLLSRGVNIYGQFYYGYFSWQKTVTDFAITIMRKVEEEPNTIEISESVVAVPKKFSDKIRQEPIVAATAKGREFRIAIEKDFGKKWKKIKIIPDKEPDVSDAKIGRYPKAKLREAYLYDRFAKNFGEVLKNRWKDASGRNGRLFVYVSKDSLKNIINYYEKKIREMYKDVSAPGKFSEEIFKEYMKNSKKSYSTLAEEYAKSFEEKIRNPKIHAHPLEVFWIKTICQDFDFRGHEPFQGYGWVNIKLKRSLDPNLKDYIEIIINENIESGGPR